MSPLYQPSDLTVESFFVLRNAFFNRNAKPRTYELRDKRNTQDDPFDEYLHRLLSEQLPKDIICLRAPGPLITPDLVLMRPKMCNKTSRAVLANDLARVAGVEVKKLERQKAGTIARPSGMDYNTTPPCGTVRVYDLSGVPIDIRGFYAFVCQEAVQRPRYYLSALVLCDGNLLNADFSYYLSIVGERTKQVGLGTYGNGANRTRPMLIFANPLGVSELDRQVTLIHSRGDLEKKFAELTQVGLIKRTVSQGGVNTFYCYRLYSDIPVGYTPFELLDPFPLPTRTTKTQPRGRFRINLQLAD